MKNKLFILGFFLLVLSGVVYADSYSFSNDGDLYLGTKLNDIITDINSSELETLLVDTQIELDPDEIDISQKISFYNTYVKFDDFTGTLDIPQTYLDLSSDTANGVLWTYEATFSEPVNFSEINDEIELLGKSFYPELDGSNLFLHRGRLVYLELNQPITYLINKGETELEIVGGNSANNTIILDVNGQRNTLEEGDTLEIGYLTITVLDNFISNIPVLTASSNLEVCSGTNYCENVSLELNNPLSKEFLQKKTVELVGANEEGNGSIILDVNGVRKTYEESDLSTLDSLDILAKDLFITNIPTISASANLLLITDSYNLGEVANSNTINLEGVGDIKGMNVSITGNSIEEIESIEINFTPKNLNNTVSGFNETEYLISSNSITDPIFGLKTTFVKNSNTYDEVYIETKSSSLELELELSNDKYSYFKPYAKNSSNEIVYYFEDNGDGWNGTDNTLEEDQIFILSEVYNASYALSLLFEVESIDCTGNEIRLKYLNNDGIYTYNVGDEIADTGVYIDSCDDSGSTDFFNLSEAPSNEFYVLNQNAKLTFNEPTSSEVNVTYSEMNEGSDSSDIVIQINGDDDFELSLTQTDDGYNYYEDEDRNLYQLTEMGSLFWLDEDGIEAKIDIPHHKTSYDVVLSDVDFTSVSNSSSSSGGSSGGSGSSSGGSSSGGGSSGITINNTYYENSTLGISDVEVIAEWDSPSVKFNLTNNLDVNITMLDYELYYGSNLIGEDDGEFTNLSIENGEKISVTLDLENNYYAGDSFVFKPKFTYEMNGSSYNFSPTIYYSTSVVVLNTRDTIPLSGTVYNSNGDAVSGDVKVSIYDLDLNLVYEETFYDKVVSGKYDFLIGGGEEELTLIRDQYYYLDLEVNGEDIDFGLNERKLFASPVGDYSQIDTNLIAVSNEDGTDKLYVNPYYLYFSGSSKTDYNTWTIKGDDALELTNELDKGVVISNEKTTIQDVMNLNPRARAPVNSSLGDLYVDSDTNELCFFNGVAWIGITAGNTCR